MPWIGRRLDETKVCGTIFSATLDTHQSIECIGVEFLSVPLRASEFGMPRNECFLPRNIGNRSESNPRNSFTTASNIIWPKFRTGDSRHRHVYVWGGGGAYRMTRNKTIFCYACSASSMLVETNQTYLYKVLSFLLCPFILLWSLEPASPLEAGGPPEPAGPLEPGRLPPPQRRLSANN
jgi:hypothetical protein